jgi:hypothetical protein
MKRKPTRKRPDTPGVLRSLVRIIHRQTEAIHLLRLDVQSMRMAQGSILSHWNERQLRELPAQEQTNPSRLESVLTVFPVPLGALATDRMTNADMERELNERLALPSLTEGAGGEHG